MEYINLKDSVLIPQLGEGVFRMPNDETTVNAVLSAIELGYRHIDTASVYGNEESVGIAIKKSGIKREEIFLTTKVWNEDVRNNNVRGAFEKSLKLLQTDYVDLYLIHWPAVGFEKAWKDLEDLYNEGRVRAIGVSNFHLHHMQELLKVAKIKPFVNQIESHPYFNNNPLIEKMKELGINVEVWSPLGGSKTTCVRTDLIINEIAKKHGKSSSQIILRWDIQRGVIPLVKSTHENRLREDLDIFDFELTIDEMKLINELDRGMRVGSDPDNFNF